MVFSCLGIYFTTFLLLQRRTSPCFWRAANPNLWLASGLGIMAALYAVHYVPFAPALTFLGWRSVGPGNGILG